MVFVYLVNYLEKVIFFFFIKFFVDWIFEYKNVIIKLILGIGGSIY